MPRTEDTETSFFNLKIRICAFYVLVAPKIKFDPTLIEE